MEREICGKFIENLLFLSSIFFGHFISRQTATVVFRLFDFFPNFASFYVWSPTIFSGPIIFLQTPPVIFSNSCKDRFFQFFHSFCNLVPYFFFAGASFSSKQRPSFIALTLHGLYVFGFDRLMFLHADLRTFGVERRT